MYGEMLSPLMTSISRSTTPVYPFNKNPSDRLTLTVLYVCFPTQRAQKGDNQGFQIKWLLIFSTSTQGLYENSDEQIKNLEDFDLSIKVANHSQRIFTLIQNKKNRFDNVLCPKLKKPQKNIIFNRSKNTLRIVG